MNESIDIKKELLDYSDENINKFFVYNDKLAIKDINLECVKNNKIVYHVLTKNLKENITVTDVNYNEYNTTNQEFYKKIELQLSKMFFKMCFCDELSNKKLLKQFYKECLKARINAFEFLYFYGNDDFFGLKQHLITSNKIYNLNNDDRGIWRGTEHYVKYDFDENNINDFLIEFVEKYQNNSMGLLDDQVIIYVSNKFLSTLIRNNHETNNIKLIEYEEGILNAYMHVAYPNIKIRSSKVIKDDTVFIVPENDAVLFTDYNDFQIKNLNVYHIRSVSDFLFFPDINIKDKTFSFDTNFAFGFPNLSEYGIMYGFELKG